MQIGAVIYHNNDTLIVDMPRSIYDLYGKLQSIGVRQRPDNIHLKDEEGDDIRVKLYGETEIGKHLVGMLREKNTLADANMLAFVFEQSDIRIRDQLSAAILQNRYNMPDQMFEDIKLMLREAAAIEKNFYFPLTGVFEDDGESFEADPSEIYRYSDQIRTALAREQSPERGGDMAQYLRDDPGIRSKLVSAEWDVEEFDILYGVVRVRLMEPFTEEEKAEFKELITGQNSDGLGEGFEQRPIFTEDGELFVSMWNSGDDYFVYDDEEMDQFLQSQGQQMGGM